MNGFIWEGVFESGKPQSFHNEFSSIMAPQYFCAISEFRRAQK